MKFYDRYMRSARWRFSAARLAELKAARRRCRICNDPGRRARLEVHHRTYRRLGREAASDLLCVCGDCHRAITDHLRRRRYAARRPAIADVRGPGGPFHALPDPAARP